MENPSPGNYAVEKQFGKGVKGGMIKVSSSKFMKDNNFNPGPGDYQPDASKLRPKTSGSVRIGQEQRKDLWSEQKKVANLPGPGNYAENTITFGQGVKGVATMGSKPKPEVNNNPGPGSYAANDSPTKSKPANVRISRAARKELWAEQTKEKGPGPGSIDVDVNTW